MDAFLKVFFTFGIQLMEGSLECHPTLSPGAPALLHCPTHSTLCVRECDWPSNRNRGLLIKLLREHLFAAISETMWSVILEMGCVDRHVEKSQVTWETLHHRAVLPSRAVHRMCILCIGSVHHGSHGHPPYGLCQPWQPWASSIWVLSSIAVMGILHMGSVYHDIAVFSLCLPQILIAIWSSSEFEWEVKARKH